MSDYKKNCGVARDLMPLAIDNVCGENSRKFLEDHLKNCDECRDTYEKMKNPDPVQGQPSPEAAATEEQQALAKSVKKTAKRMKRRKWLVILMIPVLLIAAYFIAFQVDRYLMSIEKPLPMTSYDVTLKKSEHYVALDLNIYNSPGGYMQTEITYDILTQETENGLQRAAIVTLTPTYCPNRPWHYNQGHIATFSLNGGWSSMFYAVDNVLYTINDYAYEYTDTPPAPSSSYDLHLTLGMPVAQIRVTDGETMKTLYTWGDKIAELPADSAHHFDYRDTEDNTIDLVNHATLWNTEVLISKKDMATFPLQSREVTPSLTMPPVDMSEIVQVTSSPTPMASQTPMNKYQEVIQSIIAASATPDTTEPEPTQTPAPSTTSSEDETALSGNE